MSARGRDVPVALAAGLAVALALWCLVCGPADTEVFVPVHRLACRYPMSYLNTFEGGCGAYLLDFGLFRYHRAYDYVGATSSLVYWPFWAAWRSPYSFYLLGAALLGLFSLGAARALDLGARYALIPLCYFPLAYLFIQDTGPVRMAFLSVPALALLVRATLRDSRLSRQVLFGALAAALVLVCVEDKPFYLFVAPLILVCAIALGTSAGGDSPVNVRGAARQGATALLVFGAIVTIGLGVQFLVGHSDGVTYLSYLRLRMGIIESQGIVGTGKLLVYFTLLPTAFARRMFGWDRPLMLVSTLCLIPSGILAYALWRARAVKGRVLGWMGAAYASGAAVALISGKELQPHHFVFLHLPLVLLLMHAAGQSAAGWNAVTKYVIVSTVLTIAILMWHFPPQSILERGQVFAYLSRPDVALTHVVSTSDLYDQQAVYGDDAQIVTFADPLFPSTRGDARPLMALARLVSRDILYVCRTCTRPEVQTAFAGTAIDEIEIGVMSWKLFNVRQPGR
jgi:hypothetical protein